MSFTQDIQNLHHRASLASFTIQIVKKHQLCNLQEPIEQALAKLKNLAQVCLVFKLVLCKFWSQKDRRQADFGLFYGGKCCIIGVLLAQ